ncbi:MAG: FtsW/RodA/SpoVE family cell cycle protein [Anaerolineales bacterium]|nr:FtsW/RodA/SpoVE family cell cycle protein [Anaerolineales bacterium]
MNLSIAKIERSLLGLAGMFLLLGAAALTLSPAARMRSWEADLRWAHWLGVLAWVAAYALVHWQLNRRLPERDPYLLPIAGLLSGWGLLSIWRLAPSFGLRQSLWLLAGGVLVTLGLRLPGDLGFLRRYKYVWLTSGLLLTATTLIFGTNPMGGGPRLWLGCCGVYFQPSEPLKLLLVVYLSAYLADRQAYLLLLQAQGGRRLSPLLPLLAPTLIMAGLAISILIVQRDLGTASIFIFLYTAIIYSATRRWEIAALSATVLVLAGGAGYALFDVVRVRVDAWLNPWLDPSGRSYQIVQSLLAVANGGMFGRGLGLGNPGLVPVAQSDFIFAAIAEEHGLVGSLAMLAVLALLVQRGLRVALYASDLFRRYLAAGLIAHLAAQSILIIGGNLRLLPLTGVTLPFVSYGGSSLLASLLSLLLLLLISVPGETRPTTALFPYRALGGALLLGIAAAGVAVGWWAFYRGPDLLTRTDNPRRTIADLSVPRGAILERNDTPLAQTVGEAGELSRSYADSGLGPIVGYTHPVYGQSGLEASLDEYLRGLQGNPALLTWWNHLLYGQPPEGLDVRLTLDAGIQSVASLALDERAGVVVMLNAQNGEVFVMASSPSFNANRLDETWEDLLADERSPLLNRATLGLYPSGAALGPLLLAAAAPSLRTAAGPGLLDYTLEGQNWDCAWEVAEAAATWAAATSAGCPGAVSELGAALGAEDLLDLHRALGLYTAPPMRLPSISSPLPEGYADAAGAALGLPDPANGEALAISPVQAALAAAALSNGGIVPAPQLAVAIRTPQYGWVLLPHLAEPLQALPPDWANAAASALGSAATLPANGLPIWQSVSAVRLEGNAYTWYLAGTLAPWQGAPLAIAVLLEADDPALALEIGQAVLQAAMGN